MEHLLTELKTHHREVAVRVVGAIAVNEQHMSDEQLLAKVRECYARGVKG